MRFAILCVSVWALTCYHAESIRAQATLGAPYVTVEGSQLHTNQVFGPEPAGLLDQVDAAAQRLSGRVVKLHIAAKDNPAIAAVSAEVQKRYAKKLPAVTCVVGQLFPAEANLAIDAVIAFNGSLQNGKRVEEDEFGRILHPGSRVYVSGQAEKDKADGGATIATMQSLSNSLQSVNATLDDVVQVKAFLNPIHTEKRVRSDIASFLGDRKVPVVIVEWTAATPPIEIELIAACPDGVAPSGIEYSTPPNMTASPLYSRIAKVNGAKTIYIGGMTARGDETLSAEAEVIDIFASIQEVLKQSGSDFENLAKATYYCANDDTSKALNTLRPKYYNPRRPPAASKATVTGVGREKRFIAIDLIAAPR